MSRQSSTEYSSRIGIKADDFGFGTASGNIRGGLGGSYGPSGDGGAGQGGPGEKGGGKSRSSSLGFIAAYALVLGLSGYVIMTDDSATAGAFSLFAQSDDEDSSFRVRSVRAKDRAATFDWSRSGMGELKRWEKSEVNVGDLFATVGSANVYGQAGTSGGDGFLLPGQLNQILDTTPSVGSYSSYKGRAAKTAKRPRQVASLASSAGSSVSDAARGGASGSEYQLYSFDTPKPAGVVPLNERNAGIAEAGSGDTAFWVFKGRVAEVAGFNGFDWQLDLRLKRNAHSKPARLKVSGAFDPERLGSLATLDWSSEQSTYLYQLEPGSHKRLSVRGRELMSALATAPAETRFSLKSIKAALETAAKRKKSVYVVRKFDRPASDGVLHAVLIQDHRARSWQVFRFTGSEDKDRLVSSRFETAG